MKKKFIKLALVAAMLTGIFAACNKEKNESNSNEDITVVNATNVMNSSSNIATVKALAYPNGEMIASTEYKNDGFKLNLPATVSDNYLHGIYWEEFNYWFTQYVTDKKAKWGTIDFVAYNNAGERMGEFYIVYRSNVSELFVKSMYVYVDRDCTAKGEEMFKYNCTFKKGWNILHLVNDHELTTQKPSEIINLKWNFELDYAKN